MKRRYPALVVILVSMIGIGVYFFDATEPAIGGFGTAGLNWMPHASDETGISDTWFCPGVPAQGGEDGQALVRIVNRSEETLNGTVSLMNVEGENFRLDLTLEPYGLSEVDLDSSLPGEITGAVVEVEGGAVLVEQVSLHSQGNSVAACANAAADTWYFADGYTVDDSRNQIVLANPYSQTVVARVEFALQSGYRTPAAFSSIFVPANSIRVVDLGAPGAGARGEPLLAVKVETSRGRVVAGRIQQFSGDERSGHQVTVGSPVLRGQWWFAGGRSGENFTEEYTIFNATESAVEVQPIILGANAPLATETTNDPIDLNPIPVPANSVVSFNPAVAAQEQQQALPDGAYVAVFATAGDQSIVVERATTHAVGESSATSVVLGAISRPEDGAVASDWYVPAGPESATPAALRIYNVDGATVGTEGEELTPTVTVYAIGASGPVAVPGLTEIPLPPSTGTLDIDLTDPAVLGRALLVETDNRVFVERWYPSGRGDTRVAAWAIPAS